MKDVHLHESRINQNNNALTEKFRSHLKMGISGCLKAR